MRYLPNVNEMSTNFRRLFGWRRHALYRGFLTEHCDFYSLFLCESELLAVISITPPIHLSHCVTHLAANTKATKGSRPLF